MLLNTLVGAAYAASETVAAPYQRGGDGVLDMIHHAGPMVKCILAALMLLSLGCWAVTFIKLRLLHRVQKESEQFINYFRQRKNLSALYRDTQSFQDSHVAEIFRIGYTELNRLNKSVDAKNIQDVKLHPEELLESVDRAMRGGIVTEAQHLESFLPLLATTGSTAPFIGLFGTVWGIMTSFQEIGVKGSANLAVVAPGISEALVATAIGLAAAIPAVVAYNYFTNRIRVMENEMNYFAADFMNLLKRDLMRRIKQEGSGGDSQSNVD
ncbi:MAG: protein TolQ [Syntrophobacteraceae bacterium]|jgi:biopolymer transport protein TolQ